MLYVQLDTNWPDNHKVIDAGIDGAGAHAIVLCLAKRLEKDGWVRRSLLARYGIDAGLIDRLTDLELLEVDEARVRPWDWHSRNPSQGAIDARRARKIEAGKMGNHERWQHPWPFDDCPKCHPSAQVVAGSDPAGSHGESPGIASHRTPTKSQSVVATAIAPAIDLERHPSPELPEDVRASSLAEIRSIKSRNPYPAVNGTHGG